MKLDEKTKGIIDSYFEKISSEDLLKLLTEKYNMRVNETYSGSYDTFFLVGNGLFANGESFFEYSNSMDNVFESETSVSNYMAA
ncbi:MAG: hypothetical protein IKO99_04200 [Bacteroidales bacterium]|nr:hypothetical protein [Bacteroidales bacterium]